eukprot:CAMPEP_0170516600 /NCGR_PEP_ID=MMETSP0209-20121228/2779_1 /TAXON_ID=665100 ORGANISM="Litonotus pictus, Strain P1" /NCGR_SAMPLE_ID=MMETSP0209 /ASSEMBLY_ACC=CAM_ASM_000301 /LENGTH=205 /DNA_ID=CAMNT_0010801549 /DNA_START=146 /DNA_END=760 /DNA_ORIENTATION=+
MDKYSDPRRVINKNVKEESNRKPNFDLNIDFGKTSMKSINELIEQNIINNQNKISYMKNTTSSNLSTLNKDNKVEDFLCNTQRSNIMSKFSDYSMGVQNQIGTQTNDFIKKDLVGLYFTTRSGLANNLLRGHGPNQHNFDKTEHISMKDLTMDKKIRTDTILEPHFSTKEKFFFKHDKFGYGNKDPNSIKRYKKYGEFTKYYDQT